MSLDRPSQRPLNASSLRVAIIGSRYNEGLVDELIANCKTALQADSVTEIEEVRVPGAAELPLAAKLLADRQAFDALICVGVVIAGDTNHHEIIGASTASGLMTIGIEHRLPVINGILVVNTLEQAQARTGTAINRGDEFAKAAIEMALLTERWISQKNQ